METIHSEVVIVGAGPAGCVLAYLLARTGVDVRLIERETDLNREFRGYFFQPLVARLFDQMGIFTQLLTEVEHEKVSTLSVDVFGRSFPALDFTTLSESPKYGLYLEQPPLLRFIIEQCEEYGTFTFHDGTTATGLMRENTDVLGITARNRKHDERIQFRSRLVIGADGRYSTIRNQAGIHPGRRETDVDILWFGLP